MPLRDTNSNQTLNRWADDVDNSIAALHRRTEMTAKTVQAVAAATAPLDVPPNATNCLITQAGYLVDGVVYVELTCTYTSPKPIGTFDGVYLVAQGYRGSNELVKVGEHTFRGTAGGSATFKVTLNRTYESVNFFFVSKNSDEAARDDWQNSPFVIAFLDGNAQNIAITLGSIGKNILPNPGFEFNASNTTVGVDTAVNAPVADGWWVFNKTSPTVNVIYDTVARTGTRALRIRTVAFNTALPSDGLQKVANVRSALIPCTIGDIIRISGWIDIGNNIAVPAGVSLSGGIGVHFLDSAGAFLGSLATQVSGATIGFNAYTFVQVAQQVPATIGGGVPSAMKFTCFTITVNSSGATLNPGANTYSDFVFDDLKLVIQNTAFDLTPINTAYTATGANPVTASTGGTANHATVSVAASTLQYGDGQVAYSAGSVTPLNDSTLYYVYCDDPTYSGGAVAYQASTVNSNVNASNGRVYFGKVTTPAFGGGVTPGLGGGNGACFSPNTLLHTRRGSQPFYALTLQDEVLTLSGWKQIARILIHDYSGPMHRMANNELVTPGHHLWRDRNWQPAHLFYPDSESYHGPVYNLEVLTDDDTARNYILSNGEVAHNVVKQ